MRRTRLTAATVAGMIALGGTIAGASGDDTADQTVTITVVETEALELSISENPDFDLSITAREDTCAPVSCATASANPLAGGATLTATNPTNAFVPLAKITVTRTSSSSGTLDDPAVGRHLSLGITTNSPSGLVTSGSCAGFSQPVWGRRSPTEVPDESFPGEELGVEKTLAAGIEPGTSSATVNIGANVQGFPGTAETTITSELVYTIAPQGELTC